MEKSNETRMYDVAEIQLSYKSHVKPSLRPVITSSRDAYQILAAQWDDSKIEFVNNSKSFCSTAPTKYSG